MGIKEWPIIRYAVCVDCGKSFPVRREIGDMERCEPHRKSEAKRRHFEKHPEAYARKLERERVRALNRTPEQVAQKKEREALARNSPDGRKNQQNEHAITLNEESKLTQISTLKNMRRTGNGAY